MIFSKLGRDNLPLWWLIFKGEKTVTRRPPPCSFCREKWWNHFGYPSNPKCPPTINLTKYYEPDLSRWQPKIKVMKNGLYDGNQIEEHTFKEIAVQPKRTKAAICTKCGAWKEWHTEKYRYEHQNQHWEWGIKIEICDHYEPLKVKIKSVMTESEYDKSVIVKVGKAIDEVKPDTSFVGGAIVLGVANSELIQEAHREGFNNWNDLQEALGMYPKGTPLARIEFEKVV